MQLLGINIYYILWGLPCQCFLFGFGVLGRKNRNIRPEEEGYLDMLANYMERALDVALFFK